MLAGNLDSCSDAVERAEPSQRGLATSHISPWPSRLDEALCTVQSWEHRIHVLEGGRRELVRGHWEVHVGQRGLR
jgi:hypothetical protein